MSSSFWLTEGDVSPPCETIDAELLREDVQTLLSRFGALLNTAIGFPRLRLVAGCNSDAGALRSGDTSRDDVLGGQDSDKSRRFPCSSGHGITGISRLVSVVYGLTWLFSRLPALGEAVEDRVLDGVAREDSFSLFCS